MPINRNSGNLWPSHWLSLHNLKIKSSPKNHPYLPKLKDKDIDILGLEQKKAARGRQPF